MPDSTVTSFILEFQEGWFFSDSANFFLKLKSGDFTSKLTYKDDKPDMKLAYHHDLDVADLKLKLKGKVRTNGDHDVRAGTTAKISN